MRNLKTKELLDALAAQYETKEFIENDPVKFPRAFFDAGDYRNTELAAFFCSMLAWGNRKVIMKDCDRLIHDIMKGDPYGFVMHADSLPEDMPIHRTIKGADINYMTKGLRPVLKKYGYLIEMAHFKEMPMLFMRRLRELMAYANGKTSIHLPDPTQSSAKRIHMMLRWMVRKQSPVDMGMWDLPQEELMMPVDVHVQRMASELGLMKRKGVDENYVSQLTMRLQEYDYEDPVKYDFALFGYGITHKEDKR